MLELRTDQIVGRSEVESPRSPSRTWTAVVFAGGLIGAVCGTLGILLSLLTMFRLITRNRASGNITVALIVIALSSLFGAAHGMDKIREIEKREKHERFMKELSQKDQ
jgi:hypothetical protein